MAASVDTHLWTVVDDGWTSWTTTPHSISRPAHFNQAAPMIQVESFRRMTVEDNRSATHFGHPIPTFHPRLPTQLTPLRSQYDSYPVPEYGSYMVQHPNPYVEYPIGYGNVSGPSLYPIPLVTWLPTTGVFPCDFGQRPMLEYYYPTPANQMPQHLSVSPFIPGSSTRYMGNFDQQSNIIPGPPSSSNANNIIDRSPDSLPSHSKPRALHISSCITRRRRLEPTLRLPCSLLGDFRSNKDSQLWNLKDIFGHIVEFSCDQHGYGFILQKLEVATDEEKQHVFDEIVPTKMTQLVRDVFGNWVVQKLLDFGTQAQKTNLLLVIEQNVVSFSFQIYGCHVVQKAIEYTSSEQQLRIILKLQPHILNCVKDAHGNHVILKLIEVASPERLMFLSTISDHTFDLATHPYGYRVLLQCLKHLPEEHTISLLVIVYHFAIHLMQNQYGSYVIQLILQQGRPQDKSRLISKIRGSLIQLAQHKVASRVCEKALIYADADTRRLLINEIMTPQLDGTSGIWTMVRDQHAYYVLQRALEVVENDQQELFFHQVKPILVAFGKSTTVYKRPISIERLIDHSPGTKLSDNK